jgi:hypothetical protein
VEPKRSVAGSLAAVPRRSLILLCVAVLAVAGGVVIITRGGGDKPRTAVADPLAEALSFAPASSELVVSVDTTPGSQQRAALNDLTRKFPAARFGADALRSGVRAIGLDADRDLPVLLGGPLVVAGSGRAVPAIAGAIRGLQVDLVPLLRTGALAAIVGRDAKSVDEVFSRAADDGRLRELSDVAPGVAQYALPDDAARVGVRDADVVLAGDAARLRAGFALHDRGGGLTRAAFAARLGPLAGPAFVRVAALPRVLIGDRARGVPWVDALRSGALALRIEPPGLRLRAHLATDPTRLRPQDLPLAPGAAPPSPAPGRATLSAGVRGLDQTIRFLDATRGDLRLPFLAPVVSALNTLDSVKGPLKTFGRIDVDAALIDQLTGTTTITREVHGIAIRAQLRDGGPLRTALNRIAAIPDIAIDLADVTDLDLDKSGDDAYEVRRKGTTFMRVAVLGDTLVATTDLTAGLRAIANRRPVPAPGPGALAVHAQGAAIQDLIIRQLGLPGLARLILGGVGDLDVAARAELRGVDAEATLTLND